MLIAVYVVIAVVALLGVALHIRANRINRLAHILEERARINGEATLAQREAWELLYELAGPANQGDNAAGWYLLWNARFYLNSAMKHQGWANPMAYRIDPSRFDWRRWYKHPMGA